ncbi:MAG: flagellar biosynthetic protein FliR [Planctomycetota bacterium]
MTTLLPIYEQVVPWSLVFTRVLGIMLFAPVLSTGVIPVRAKAMFAAMMAVAVYGLVPPEFRVPPGGVDLQTLAPLLFSEILIGISIGMIMQLPFMAIEMCGQMIGYQMGLSIARSFNPSLETDMNSIGSLIFYMGLYSFVMLGGLEAMLTAVLITFETVPRGGFGAGDAPLQLFVAVITATFKVAMALAAPVLGAAVILLISLGFIMKTMPQLNLLGEGFAMKILSGITILIFATFAIDRTVAEHTAAVTREILMWAESLGGGGLGDAG